MKETLNKLCEAADLLSEVEAVNESTAEEIKQLRFEINALIQMCQRDTNAAIQININRILDRANDLTVQAAEENIYT